MDNRCAACGKDLGRRKLGYSVVARMDVDCFHCHGALQVNPHPLERALVLGGTGTVLALAVLSYRMQNQGLLLAAMAAGMAAGGALALLERTWLRDWPRYISRPPRPGME